MEAQKAEVYAAMVEAIIEGDKARALEAARVALEAGIDPYAMVQECLAPAVEIVGRKFESKEFFLVELMLSAEAMKAATNFLRPHFRRGQSAQKTGKFVIGSVKGDVHDIGKNIVGSMMECAGFEVIDLGVDVSKERFIEAVREAKPDLLGMSALHTPVMVYMKEVIEALSAAGLRDSLKVIVGGAPVTEAYATKIGADLYGKDAHAAVTLSLEAVSRNRAGGGKK